MFTKAISNDKKRRLLVETSETLFLRFGAKRVSIQEICDTAGVSTSAFYKNFHNKIDLIKFTIQNVYNATLAKYISIVESKKPFPEKISLLIKLRLEIEQKRIPGFLTELEGTDNGEISMLSL